MVYRLFNTYLNVLVSIDSIPHTYILYSLADALFRINYCTLQLSALQLNNFREQKMVMSICQNLIIHTVLYCAICYCIGILRRQYIDTCKSCIVPSLHNHI